MQGHQHSNGIRRRSTFVHPSQEVDPYGSYHGWVILVYAAYALYTLKDPWVWYIYLHESWNSPQKNKGSMGMIYIYIYLHESWLVVFFWKCKLNVRISPMDPFGIREKTHLEITESFFKMCQAWTWILWEWLRFATTLWWLKIVHQTCITSGGESMVMNTMVESEENTAKTNPTWDDSLLSHR